MAKPKSSEDDLITNIISGIDDVKGIDINLFDLRDIDNMATNYFIICTGRSNTHVNAIVSSVKKKVSKVLKEKPYNSEGNNNCEWVLLDYVNVVVHVFQKKIREYYNIEGLWGDAKNIKIASNY
jgi:ribosome-associated protein